MQKGFNHMEYFNYYLKHTYNVVLVWKDIREVLIDNNVVNEEEFEKINRLVIWHDNSKISKEEFEGYGLKFFGTEENQKNYELFKQAWDHHKKNNLHHHQSLKNYNGEYKKCYIIEMICDWIAMGWESGSLAQDYYEEIKDNIDLLDEDKALIQQIFNLIKENNCYANHKITEDEKRLLFFF